MRKKTRAHPWVLAVDVHSEDSGKDSPAQVWQHQVGCVWGNLVELHDGCAKHTQQGCKQICNEIYTMYVVR